jgi:hypothetical protein
MNPININQGKILLVLLPFWTPLTPPMGITCLKSFLQKYGCRVTAVDASAEKELKDYSDEYFNTLKEMIPENKRGNFYSVVHQALRNHMMAHINYNEKNRYLNLVKTLVYKSFYFNLDEPQVRELVRIIDEFYVKLEEYVIDLLEKQEPALLGLSVYSDTLAPSVFVFRLTREKYPHIVTVMGGGVFADHLAPGAPDFEDFLEETKDYIDKIIIGEGEHLFLKLLEGGLPGAQRVFTLKDIHGKTLDLSTAPLVDLSDFDLGKYPYMASYTSRSCPFQCSFCSETVQWGNYRKKSPRQVYNELVQLYQTHGTQLFLLGDSLLNPVISGLAKEFINSEETLYWEGWLRAEAGVCNSDNTLSWRRGGFYHARIGAESGSQRILEKMGKKITPLQIKDAVSSLAYAGIKTSTLWIVGHPGETEEDFQQTLKLIEELKYDIYEAEGTPFWYYLSGQSNWEEWRKNHKQILLYPEQDKDMLMVQSWILDGEPTREETFNRLQRFIRHIDQLGIPNTYSLLDIYKADERWKNLQKNAVPAFMEFKNKDSHIDECRRVKKLAKIESINLNDVNFGF